MAARAQPASALGDIIVLPWPDFQRMFYAEHKQGEHVSLVGQTGSGKSTCGLELAKIVGMKKGKDGRPSRVVVLGNKKRDDTLMALHTRDGWPIITQWPPAYGEEHCIVWPRKGTLSQMAAQHRTVYRPLVDVIGTEGSQTLVIDEAAYFEEPAPEGLGMSPTMRQIWSGSRSNKLTMIAGTQRPRNVARLMWSEPSWVIIFPPDDIDDLRRVAEMSGRKRAVLEIADPEDGTLGGFEFLCIKRKRGGQRALYVSRVDRPTKRARAK